VSGYLIIILFLVIEKKMIDYVDETENTIDLIDPAEKEIVEENKLLKDIIEQEL